MNPMISVVIPAFKRKDELFRCLRSILASTYPHYEILVLNNSGEPGILNAVQAEFPMVKTIELVKNTGIYALNIGFANARGEYILGIDDDCGLRPDTLEQIVKSFAEMPANVGAISASIYNPLYDFWCMRSTPERPLVHLCCLADGATVFKREVFHRVGYYDDDFFCWQHGPDLSVRMLGVGYKIRFGDRVVIDHYENRPKFRPIRAFYDFRNMAWLNIKDFSLVFFPLLLARNFLSFCALPVRQRSLLACVVAAAGYITGWATFLTPLRKRHVPSFAVQKKFVMHFVFNKFPNE